MHDLVNMAIRDFNQTLGVRDFDSSGHEVVDFSFEAGDHFHIKSTDEGALFYLIREIADYRINAISSRALALCHYDRSRKFDTRCVLKDSNEMIFVVFMTAQELNGPEIENVLQYLMKLHDTLSPQ